MTDSQAPDAATVEQAETQGAPENDTQTQSSAANELEALLEQMSAPAPAEEALEEEPAEGTEAEPLEEEPVAEEEPKRKSSERVLPNRISTKQFNDLEQEAISLKHDLKTAGEDISLEDAIALVKHRRSEGSSKQAPEAVEDPLISIDAQITAYEQEAAALDQQIADTPFDPEVQAELRKKQSKVAREIGKLEAQKEFTAKQRESEARKAVDSEADAFFQSTVKSYPTAFRQNEEGRYEFDTSTRLGRLAASRYKLYQGTQAANAPDFLATLVSEAADTIGFETPPSTQSEVKTPPPSQKRSVRPVATGGIQPTTQSESVKAQQLISSGSLEDLKSALSAWGTPI